MGRNFTRGDNSAKIKNMCRLFFHEFDDDDFFMKFYTTLPHNLIKETLLDLIERTFYKKEGKLYLACNE